MRKILWKWFLLTCISAGLALLLSAVDVGDNYWVPVDPPKCHYVIDAKIDLSEGFIAGTETVTLKNNFDRAIGVVAFDWRISQSYAIDVAVDGEPLNLLNGNDEGSTESPLFYRLPEPIEPGRQVRFQIEFENRFEVDEQNTTFGRTSWYPRVWWDGLPVHDSFAVKVDVPEGWAMAISGRLNANNGRYEIDGARTFGIHLAKDHMSETREIDGIQVTTLFTEKGAMAAEACMDTAVDAIGYYKDWLGFYPHEFLYIIPGGPGRWGGYPFATGIVVIHGEETFREGEPLTHWQRITAHEIGHEYWGEWVLDPERPAWVWIGMGIFADTEYILARGIDPGRRQGWMSNYLNGAAMYNDTTVDIPPAQLAKIRYDHNNTVIHSKGFSIVSALDCALGRERFESIYKKCLDVYGGRRLGWRELQRFFEKESGLNLSWFFDQWVRSNAYLCTKIVGQESKPEGDVFKSVVKVKRLGTMAMPVPVKAVFADGSEQVKNTDRSLETSVLTFTSRSAMKEAVIDPEQKLAMLEEPLSVISDEAAEMLSLGWDTKDSPEVYKKIKDEKITNSGILYRIGMGLYEFEDYAAAFDCFQRIAGLRTDPDTRFAAYGWQGLLKDILGDRDEALRYYRQALDHDTGESMSHSWLRIVMNRQWVEERLKTPFSFETLVDIPSQPTAEELQEIVGSLNWKREGRTPYFIFEKTKGLNIESRDFWFKLGMLLFDSGYYPEAFTAMENVSREGTSKLMIFAAYTWMGHLKDLLSEREEAMVYYRLALEHDTGDAMTHSQFGMRIDRAWVEKRLAVPFTWKKR